MRPLMATVLRPAETRASIGRYDEAAGLTIGSDGRPLAMAYVLGETETRVRQEPTDPTDPWMFETATAVRNEPPDDGQAWAFETFTEVRDESADDERTWAFETMTKVRSEPADDEQVWALSVITKVNPEEPEPPLRDLPLPARDDPATGVVAF